MATESNLLDLEIEYDDDELDEHEELELENKSKQLKEQADFLKRDCKSLDSSQPSSSSAPRPSSFSRVEATIAAILDQLQLLRSDLGDIRETQAIHSDRLYHLIDGMCQMNTKIVHIARHQSRLGGFPPSPECDSFDASLESGDDDDASGSSGDEMTTSQ
ncbi:uncharacterized protein LOC136070666 [Quercus suber]|uniref:uncharacterized protein LOC136070666 n=1 Tax=Quercus suber TaxID=58331 RepID=UPI000D2CCAF8|nr:hypothetical protein CFP56_14142 [Quercus suber]